MPLSHYEILGVPRDSTGQEIRQAYRREVLAWHPDRNPTGKDAHRRFLAIQNAYEVLMHPGRRATYDGVLKERAAVGMPEKPASPLPRHVYPKWLRDVLFPQPLYEPIFNRKRFATGLPLTKILLFAVAVFVVGVVWGKWLAPDKDAETYEEKRDREQARVKAVERADSAWFRTHGPLLKPDSARATLVPKRAVAQ